MDTETHGKTKCRPPLGAGALRKAATGMAQASLTTAARFHLLDALSWHLYVNIQRAIY